MSLGYAEKISYRRELGSVGMSEIFDPPHLLQEKIAQLAALIKESKHLVAFTGAGISTSCGIPDFRGPNGVWTLQSEGKAVPEASLPFHRAMPSITHMFLVELEKAGILKCVISQNVDSLHLRSGIPREKLAELHGNSFRENCPSCGVEYLRDFEVETVGMKKTPRRCADVNCKKRLKDNVVDLEGALPLKEMNLAEEQCKRADVVLCLGTSLQITPAANFPLKSLPGGGKIVIVNLQATPRDRKASLVIHGRCDKVIAGLINHLDLRIPPYVRVDLFQISISRFGGPSQPGSVFGLKNPLPFIKSVEVSFLGRPLLKTSVLTKEPFVIKREFLRRRPFTVVLKLNFCDGCGVQSTIVELPINFQADLTISNDRDAVIDELKTAAIESGSCGKTSLIERKTLSQTKEIAVFAVSTNLVRYDGLLESPGLAEDVAPENNANPDEKGSSDMP